MRDVLRTRSQVALPTCAANPVIFLFAQHNARNWFKKDEWWVPSLWWVPGSLRTVGSCEPWGWSVQLSHRVKWKVCKQLEYLRFNVSMSCICSQCQWSQDAPVDCMSARLCYRVSLASRSVQRGFASSDRNTVGEHWLNHRKRKFQRNQYGKCAGLGKLRYVCGCC